MKHLYLVPKLTEGSEFIKLKVNKSGTTMLRSSAPSVDISNQDNQYRITININVPTASG